MQISDFSINNIIKNQNQVDNRKLIIPGDITLYLTFVYAEIFVPITQSLFTR